MFLLNLQLAKLSADTKKALLKRKDVNLLTYNDLYHIIKDEPEYRVLNCNMSQQILKLVDRSFKSFFGLLKAKSNKTYNKRVKLPSYLKKEGHFSLIIAEFSFKNGMFTVPMNMNYANRKKISFELPPILKDKTVKEIRIIPKQNARLFEVQYIYEKEISKGIYNKKVHCIIKLATN